MNTQVKPTTAAGKTEQATVSGVVATAPVGTPPGGGRWTWDAAKNAWQSLDVPAEPTESIAAADSETAV